MHLCCTSTLSYAAQHPAPCSFASLTFERRQQALRLDWRQVEAVDELLARAFRQLGQVRDGVHAFTLEPVLGDLELPFTLVLPNVKLVEKSRHRLLG